MGEDGKISVLYFDPLNFVPQNEYREQDDFDLVYNPSKGDINEVPDVLKEPINKLNESTHKKVLKLSELKEITDELDLVIAAGDFVDMDTGYCGCVAVMLDENENLTQELAKRKEGKVLGYIEKVLS